MSLGMLVEGKWSKDWTEHDKKGNFNRMKTVFRNRPENVSEKDRNRYCIYASYGCPWAHRVIMSYGLFGFEDFMDLIIVEPHISEDGWYFSEEHPDKNYSSQYLREVYLKAKNDYTGRVTVPVLWDKELQIIVNNESLEILDIFNTEFKPFAKNQDLNLFRDKDREEIDTEIAYNYENINNACYRTGFAKSQEVYDEEVVKLFAELDKLEKKLEDKAFLVGERLSAADICLLPTLLRFDTAYYSIFKCNLRPLKSFENIDRYMRALLEDQRIAETFKPFHIKSLYYKVPDLNPTGIIPKGPIL